MFNKICAIIIATLFVSLLHNLAPQNGYITLILFVALILYLDISFTLSDIKEALNKK